MDVVPTDTCVHISLCNFATHMENNFSILNMTIYHIYLIYTVAKYIRHDIIPLLEHINETKGVKVRYNALNLRCLCNFFYFSVFVVMCCVIYCDIFIN